jgi:hypothetical protein
MRPTVIKTSVIPFPNDDRIFLLEREHGISALDNISKKILKITWIKKFSHRVILTWMRLLIIVSSGIEHRSQFGAEVRLASVS